MPVLPDLLRRQGPTTPSNSDHDIRRHSFYSTESKSNPNVAEGRASEQIPRRPSAAEFLSPETAAAALPVPSISRTSVDDQVFDAQVNVGEQSPPIQEKTPRHHRFSMLKFRHASDSQLSARARLQSNRAPPMPQREAPKTLLEVPNREYQWSLPEIFTCVKLTSQFCSSCHHHNFSYSGRKCKGTQKEI